MPKLGVKLVTSETDRGWNAIRTMVKNIREKDSYVKFGVLDNGGPGSAVAVPATSFIGPSTGKQIAARLTLAALAAIHEFGSADGRIPERSFVRSTFDANEEVYVGNLKTLLGLLYDQKITVFKILSIMGQKVSADIKKRVTSGDEIAPPNSPATYRRKALKGNNGGAPRTLVDTGQMIGAVTYQVVLTATESLLSAITQTQAVDPGVVE